ncbi:hypothetical protein DACRYDRAFT_110759 [Dacryopinax primogenitus]|uniref:Uncharacterized protein n=1 Tax=Dacryopinax primogenitus (strain DJM 731) TaxID=1858805 RepID=M5FST1_DACPD|nr:uncharacterized protein DACRYDRAFT_110759 [Dacryopinax primogenitus]EJT98319.1 hypothetical protein DACRYDRAFT_110759 [Dacryopinax primogenitus]
MSMEGLCTEFMRLRQHIYVDESKLCRITAGTRHWELDPFDDLGNDSDSVDHEDDMEEDDGSAAHLAHWLGRMTENEVLKSPREDVLWWLVELQRELIKLDKKIGELWLEED